MIIPSALKIHINPQQVLLLEPAFGFCSHSLLLSRRWTECKVTYSCS